MTHEEAMRRFEEHKPRDRDIALARLVFASHNKRGSYGRRDADHGIGMNLCKLLEEARDRIEALEARLQARECVL